MVANETLTKSAEPVPENYTVADALAQHNFTEAIVYPSGKFNNGATPYTSNLAPIRDTSNSIG